MTGNVNFRASYVEPRPGEVFYWVDLNEDSSGGSIKYWNLKGYWQTIRVLEGSMAEFELRIKDWVTEELLKQNDLVDEKLNSFEGRIVVVEDEIKSIQLTKQDILTPGFGIEITKDNVVNCTIDLSLYKVVAELPTEDIDESKIYIIFDPDGTGTNTHEEYVYVNGKWELLGKYADYASRIDFLQEIEDRLSADNVLDLKITGEIERASLEEQEIKSNLTSEVTRLEDLIKAGNPELVAKLQEEIDRSIAKDTELDKMINNEIARATRIEKNISDSVVEETNRATSKEDELKQLIELKLDVITEVNVTIDENIGTPSASASVELNTLNIDFKNIKGQLGPPNELKIGSVTNGEDAYSASADIVGNYPDQLLNLVLPRGLKGDSGVQLGDVALVLDFSTEEGSENKVISQLAISYKILSIEDSVVCMTQEEYDSLTVKDPDKFYYIYEV